MPILNDRIRERRIATGKTLLDVAELLGIQEATMQRYESGKIKNIKHETIVALADIFHCSPSYLMGWDDDQQDTQDQFIEKSLIDKFRQLDKKGKSKVLDYTCDLINSGIYTYEASNPSSRGRRFDSCHSDHKKNRINMRFFFVLIGSFSSSF